MHLNKLSAALALILSGCTFGGEKAAMPASAVPGAAVVVELFTSEGCSSCPAADRKLAKIFAAAHADNRPVYGLAWHVDYWNRLGWADPYSSHAATERQMKYSATFKQDDVYTPQMIVNGHAGFVGSDDERANSEINAALAHPAPTEVKLGASKLVGNQVSIDYATQRAPAGAMIEIVAAERGLASQVKAGENGGRTLTHENVVRAFTDLPLADHPAGQATLTLPPGVDPTHVTLIALVQDARTLAISGAASTELSPVTSAAP